MDEEFIPILEILEELKKINKNLEERTTKEKVGHWTPGCWPYNMQCSICGGEPYFGKSIYEYKFCPFCGARMKGEDYDGN